MKSFLSKAFFLVFLVSCSYSLSLTFDNPKSHHLHEENLHKSHKKFFNHKRSHKYYNVQQTRRVSLSKSIKQLNECKDLCLKMHQLFPFEFKYHRLVYRQEDGDMKYIVGECFYTFRESSQENKESNKQEQNKKAQQSEKNQNPTKQQKKWYPWSNLNEFISMQAIQDPALIQQKKAFKSYAKDCEDDSLKLSESSRIDFKFTIVHSDFQYYQNQGFKNMQPFDDFDQLLDGLQE